MLLRLLPLVGVVALLAVCFWRAWLQSRRIGTSGVMLFRSGRRDQHVRDALLCLLCLLLLGQAIAAAVGADRPARLAFLPPTLALALGGTLLLGGIALLVIAQLNLGASWRIGIDTNARAGLVTGGVYRFSRNPIYLGLLISIAGYAVLLPTLLSAALLLGTYLGIRLQTAAEESYLVHTYGEAFREYSRRVGRLLPGVGKLR
jgi:protein-S-isoprenylcysteine O-methyltransferase Ste14